MFTLCNRIRLQIPRCRNLSFFSVSQPISLSLPFKCHRYISVDAFSEDDHTSSSVGISSLSELNYFQLKALAKAVGLPANQKKDKILKMLLAHFDYSTAEIPNKFKAEIAEQLNSNKKAIRHSAHSESELDFNEEVEAEMLSKTIQRFCPDVDPERLQFALTYPGLQIMGRTIGLKSNAKRVILLKQINAYCDCMLDLVTGEGGLRDLVLPKPDVLGMRRPMTASGRLRSLRNTAGVLDRETLAYSKIPVVNLRRAAKAMKLKCGYRKIEIIEALKERRKRELAGEVFDYNEMGRVLSPDEIQQLSESKRLRMPQIKTFGSFLRTKHLKGAVVDSSGVYHTSRIKEVMEHLQHKGTVPREVVVGVIRDAQQRSQTLPNVITINRPRLADGTVGCLTVCGDLLGDLDNLVHIFGDGIGGFPSEDNPYVFMGDYVDKGAQSFEVLFTLLLLKLAAPKTVHLLRGAHETTVMNSKFGFEDQILRLYDAEILQSIRQLFCAMPVAAVIENKVFVVHGGIGRETSKMTIQQLNSQVDRVTEPSTTDALSELLWADPCDKTTGFAVSRNRGGGYSFGEDVTRDFLQRNGLDLMLRSHECVSMGYDSQHSDLCTTLFSLPMYYGHDSDYPNFGAIARFELSCGGMTPRYVQFDSADNSELEEDLDYIAGAV